MILFGTFRYFKVLSGTFRFYQVLSGTFRYFQALSGEGNTGWGRDHTTGREWREEDRKKKKDKQKHNLFLNQGGQKMDLQIFCPNSPGDRLVETEDGEDGEEVVSLYQRRSSCCFYSRQNERIQPYVQT